jgi:hypothetical protein
MQMSTKQRYFVLGLVNVVAIGVLWSDPGWSRALAYCLIALLIIGSAITLISSWISNRLR